MGKRSFEIQSLCHTPPFIDPCGNYNNASGVLMSPGYPHEYQNEKECIYTITVAQNHIIKIMFSEFNLEHENNCNSDFLQIADGGSEFSTEIWRFCGNLSNVQHILLSNQGSIRNDENHTHTLYSTQNKMWVR